MTELDKLEESKELNSFKTIPIFKQIKKENIIEGLYSFYKSLTTEEKTILNILFESKDPLSVRQIRKKIAIKIALENKEKIAKIPFISKKLEKFKWKHTELFTHMEIPTLESVLPNLTDKETTMLVSILNKISSSKVPSYYTIASILDFFEKQGLVARRELVGRKAESVWYLSPIFLKILLYTIKTIKGKSNSSMIEQELLSMLEIKS
jgi:Fe2+ or Zn2+ uptake regulation protein